MPVSTRVREATPGDAAILANIYNHYVAHTIVTFEEAPVSAEDVAARITEVQAAGLPWLVAAAGDVPRGFAYASRWKGRCAYRFSAEITVYVDDAARGQGIGALLYGELLARLVRANVHVVIGGIALPNDASVALHEKFGLRKVAHFGEVGFKFGQWIDVGYWQRVLEPARSDDGLAKG